MSSEIDSIRKKVDPKPRRPRRGNNQPDKWDRIKLHLVHGDPLPDEEQIFVNRARLIWGKMINGAADREVVDWIVEQGWSKQRQAYHLLRDTKRLYGLDPAGTNLVAEKKLLLERAQDLYALCKEKEKYREAASLLKFMQSLLDGFNQEHNLKDLYETLKLPAINYTSDPVEAGVVDIDYEDA